MVNILLPLLLLAVGLFLLFKLRFFFVLHPVSTVRQMLMGLRDRRSRRSLFLALSGTLGVGNIFGVAAGIMVGGEGVVLWIFLSSLLSATIKYAEALLANGATGGCGMAEVISSFFGRRVAIIYAALTLALAWLMGGAMQSAALRDVAFADLGLHPVICSLALIVLLAICLAAGVERIDKITEILIPLTTIIYILSCFIIIFLNFDKLPGVINRIISSAFRPSSVALGVLPVALREGFARGVLSNEAGIGTSATAHVRGGERTPHLAGLFGILEVFFDTTLLCTLTGVTILLSVSDLSSFSTPMSLVRWAFVSSLGDWSGILLTLMIFSFAFATVICWLLYGSLYAEGYFRGLPFKPLFFLSLLLPIGTGIMLSAIDTVIFLMAIITLSAIIKGKERIITLSRRGLYKSDS